MDKESKLPSWLQDRKKAVILTIVILAMIVSGFNTYSAARTIVNNAVDTDGIASGIENSLASVFKTNYLEGTYQNFYVEELMTYSKDGTVVYSYGGETVFGTYEIDETNLYLTLDGYEYIFDILTNDGSILSLTFNGYQYDYIKID